MKTYLKNLENGDNRTQVRTLLVFVVGMILASLVAQIMDIPKKITVEFIVNNADKITKDELKELIEAFGDQEWQNGINVGQESTYDL